MSETAHSRAIQDALAAIGYRAIRVQSGRKRVGAHWMHFAPAGTPDLLVMGPGVMGWIEAKAPGGKRSPEQLEFARWCERWMIPYAVCVTAHDAVAAVREWDQIRNGK